MTTTNTTNTTNTPCCPLDPDAVRVLANLEAEAHPSGEFAHIGQLYADSFRGQSRLVGTAGFLLLAASVGLAIFAAIRFFRVDASDVRGLILWATTFLFAVVQAAMTKLWFWLNLQRNVLAREIKRIEVRLTACGE